MTSRDLWSRFVLGLAVLFTFILLASPRVAQASSTGVVISQVYGGGGNSGSTFKNDFIEVFNAGAASVDLTGWSVQYASAAGTTWQVTNLNLHQAYCHGSALAARDS